MFNIKFIIYLFALVFINQTLALRCSCTSNGFNTYSDESILCCNNQSGSIIKRAFDCGFLGCGCSLL